MSTGTVIAILVVAFVVVVVAAIAVRRSRAARDERLRYEAEQHREVAAVAQAEADRRTALAEERAARARREQLEADQAALEAEAARARAEETFLRAEELDPDGERGRGGRRREVRGEADTGAEAAADPPRR